MNVSVVVPVWNPGLFIDDCIRTLSEQTMPREDYEVIFVDDGSTDGTGERLDVLAAENANFRVIHQPNSGWPGKPRNVGTDAASGEYVLYMDQDDALRPETLERMYALGKANDSDIVMGKVVSDFRGVPHDVFRETVPVCDYRNGPLIDSLTPHKMFRRRFLLDHGIRYPEGPRRLEDQLFMVKAYLAAKRTSIVGDYLCYLYQSRADGMNAGSATMDPVEYYTNLREILDVVDAHVPPGAVRDRIYRRFYGSELLNRVGGATFVDYDEDHRRSRVAEVSRLLAERFSRALDEGMPAATRVRGALARQGDVEELVELARRYREVKATARLRALRWDGRHYVADVEAWMLFDGAPLTLQKAGDRLMLPRSMVGDHVTDDDRDLSEQIDSMLADVVVKERAGVAQWFVPPPLRARVVTEREDSARVVFHGKVPLDPASMAGGHAVGPSIQDLHVYLQFAGVKRTARLGSSRDQTAIEPLFPALTAQPDLWVTPYWTRSHDNLSLRVEQRAMPQTNLQSLRVRDHARLSVSMPLRAESGTHALTLRLTRGSRMADVALAETEEDAQRSQGLGAVWAGELPRLRAGLWHAQLRPLDGAVPGLGAGVLWVLPGGRARWVPDQWRARRLAGWSVRRGKRLARRAFRAVASGGRTRV